jgi:hypothetical protein
VEQEAEQQVEQEEEQQAEQEASLAFVASPACISPGMLVCAAGGAFRGLDKSQTTIERISDLVGRIPAKDKFDLLPEICASFNQLDKRFFSSSRLASRSPCFQSYAFITDFISSRLH